MSLHPRRFPGETSEYRAARDALLEAERDLRQHVERVAARRRTLPLGAVVPEDYALDEGTRKVRLSELFAPGRDTLVLYGFMFGPEMKAACPMCTCFLDGLNGNAVHIERQVSLAVVASSPIERLRAFAASRHWTNLRLLSSAGSAFRRDYLNEDEKGEQNSIMHVFVKREDGVHHSYSSELNLLDPEAGQDPRHIDAMWPLWNVLDLTPGGRGEWRPSLTYA